MSKLEVDAIEPQSGTTLTLGASGDTVALASGVTVGVGMGKILQVVENSSSTNFTSNSTVYAELLNASITPSSTSSKILIMCSANSTVTYGSNAWVGISVFRGTTSGTDLGERLANTNSTFTTSLAGVYVDSPSTTSSQQYTLGMRKASSGTTQVTTDSTKYFLVLMEIAG